MNTANSFARLALEPPLSFVLFVLFVGCPVSVSLEVLYAIAAFVRKLSVLFRGAGSSIKDIILAKRNEMETNKNAKM